MSEASSKEMKCGRGTGGEPACSEEAGGIKIDFDLIPDHVRDDLAAATLESVREFLRKPGGREFLDGKIAQNKAER